MITGASKVVLYVGDQDRAKDFWTGVMKFDLVQDTPYGDERWIEVMSPDRSVRIVLSPRHDGQPNRNDVSPELPHSNLMFHCNDLEETYRELSKRGVKFPQPPVEQPWGWWSMFEDTDGTRYALGRRGD